MLFCSWHVSYLLLWRLLSTILLLLLLSILWRLLLLLLLLRLLTKLLLLLAILAVLRPIALLLLLLLLLWLLLLLVPSRLIPVLSATLVVIASSSFPFNLFSDQLLGMLYLLICAFCAKIQPQFLKFVQMQAQ